MTDKTRTRVHIAESVLFVIAGYAVVLGVFILGLNWALRGALLR